MLGCLVNFPSSCFSTMPNFFRLARDGLAECPLALGACVCELQRMRQMIHYTPESSLRVPYPVYCSFQRMKILNSPNCFEVLPDKFDVAEASMLVSWILSDYQQTSTYMQWCSKRSTSYSGKLTVSCTYCGRKDLKVGDTMTKISFLS